MAESGWPWHVHKREVSRVHLVKRLGMLRLISDSDAPPMHVNPWIVPILNGEVRLQKPPLPYWCAAALFRILGTSEATARFIPALLGAVATFLLFDLARILYGSRAAWAAALIWLTTYLIPEEYRAAMADPYLGFFTLLALWSWVRASLRVRSAGGVPPALADSGQTGMSAPPKTGMSGLPDVWIATFYVAVALGALAKGPLILLHVAVPLMLFHLCFRAPFPRGFWGHLVGALLFLLIAAPWPLAVLHQVPNATELWRYESVGEISGENPENARAWWYYLANLPLLAAPWCAFWLYSLVYPFRRRRATVLFPVLWYGLIVLSFTVVAQKKNPYLLPMMPAQAMMISLAAVPLLRLARRMRMRGLAGALIAIQAVIGLGWAASLPVLAWRQMGVQAIPLLLCGLAIILAILPLREMFKARPARWLVSQTVAYAAVLLVFCNCYVTPLNNARSPVALCHELESLADGTHRAILISKVPEEVAFYLPLHPKQGPAPSEYLVVVDDQKGVQERERRRTSEPPPNLQEFEGCVPDAKLVSVRRVAMISAPGDARWKVFELTVRRTALARSAPFSWLGPVL